MSETSPPKKQGVTPSILSPDCDKHIAWIKAVFKAEEHTIFRTRDERKKVNHCDLIINGGYLAMCDREVSMEKGKEEETETEGVVLHLELEDPSKFWSRAMSNGASVIEDLRQQYWGGFYGSLRDPFGFIWGLMKGGECRKPGVIPYLILEEGTCESYLEWMVDAFGATVKDKFQSPDNSKLLQHCSVELNGGSVYLADDIKMAGQKKIIRGNKSNIICHMELADSRATWERVLQKGGESVVDLKIQFWGELYGTIRDINSFQWSMSNKNPADSIDNVGGVISYIMSPDCDKHIEWIKKVLGGEVKGDITRTEKGKVMHCQMSVNGGTMMLSDRVDCPGETQENVEGADIPHDQKGFILHLNLPDPDSVWKRALENEGMEIVQLKKQIWGDYYGMFQDPFGYRWSILKC